MAYKAIGVAKSIHIWQIYYAVKYGVFLETLEDLDEFFLKKTEQTDINQHLSWSMWP